MKIFAFCPQGYDGYLVEVECSIEQGLPCFTVVGLPDSAVKEARNRVQAAIASIGSAFPKGRVLINMSPASVKKLGSGYDLAIAAAILITSMQVHIPESDDSAYLFLGELALDGRIKANTDNIAALLSPQSSQLNRIIIAQEILDLARKLPLPNFKITAFSDLRQLLDISQYSKQIPRRESSAELISPIISDEEPLLIADEETVFAMEVAAAGMHNILLYGAPGSGKTTAARSMSAILPINTEKIALEQLRIHFRSVASFHKEQTFRSFREPHHSSSAEGILGGGKYLRPGEISLAHGAALLLDEAPEFHRNVLQNLREPMERGWVQLIRADQSSSYPCKTVFLFTMNLCPCGNRGKSDAICMCTERDIYQYWSRLGGALYDRIEIKKFFTANGYSEFIKSNSPRHKEIRRRIENARRGQEIRYGKESYNAYASWQTIESLKELNTPVLRAVDSLQRQYFLSGRQRLSILRLALTIIDLEERDTIQKEDLERAVYLMLPHKYNEYF